MSHIEDLIFQLAPNGVAVATLGEIAELVRGNGMPKTELTGEGVGAIHYGQIYTRYGAWTEDTVSYVTPETASRLAKVNPGDIIITNTSENVEDVGKAVAWLGREPIVTGGHATVIRHHEDPKYLSYWFQSPSFFSQKKALASGTKVVDVSAKQLATVRVPVPPLPVQHEIVRVLDTFTKLETGLEAKLGAELEARRRQYDHYRDSLIASTAGNVRRVTLGEAATIVRGGSPRPIRSYLTDAADGVNWIKIGDVPRGGKYVTGTSERITPEGARKSRRVEPGDFVLSNSMSFGRPYIVNIHGCIHDGWLAIKNFAGTFLPDFLYHLLRTTQVYKEMAQRAGAGTVQNLNVEIVKRLVLPVPPLAEQERIAATLDKLDELVTDLSLTLPAELKIRRTQYEHYRDLLLTFPEAT